MAELVSILIPAYNAEKWIGYAIRSALSQRWPKTEIIIVDDGSSDKTIRIAKTFESRTVKVITQPNMGACAARNKALSFAQGDYIQWLDADDLIAPDKIARQLEAGNSGGNKKVLLSSAFGTFSYNMRKARFVPNSLWQDLGPVEWMVIKFSENIWMSNAVWLVSRELTDLAGPWDERLSLNDDGEYFCRVVAASEKIKFVPMGKSYYRQSNPDSISSSISNRACESLLLSFKLCFGYLRSYEDSERTRRACLACLQRCYEAWYPEKHALLVEVHDLARELGGSLSLPEISWKYYLIERLFGWEVTKKVRRNWQRAKLIMHMNLDRLSYSMFHKNISWPPEC